MANKKRILSGVQPTGDLHIGNWLGAINNWVKLQEQYETFLCVVDLHAITASYNPKELSQNTISTAALYVACGIDPNICSIFVQSQISAHSELCWILNCMTPINWMERMIQFKEKSIQQGNNVSIGLFDYPILMAADILLYDADFVPVGEDQKQHLELARDIAQQRINARFSKDKKILKIPQPIIMKNGSKIMSLIDGSKKMSKSDPNEGSRINLLDTPEIITKKIKRAKSDSYIGIEFNNSLNYIVSTIWIMLIMNAINFIDNMDGLAVVVSSAICIQIAVLTNYLNQYKLTDISILLLCAIGGFFIFNFPPAKLYFGDSGSLFIGFCLGFMSILYNWLPENITVYSSTLSPILLIFSVPVIDFLVVVTYRISIGKSPTIGGTDHISHRLLAKGFSEKKVLTIFLSYSFGTFGLIYLSIFTPTQISYVLIGALFVLYFLAYFISIKLKVLT